MKNFEQVEVADTPQTDCETCKYGQDKHRYAHICNECGVGINNYTPQTDIHGLTDCDFCKGKNCEDCEGGKDEPQTDCGANLE